MSAGVFVSWLRLRNFRSIRSSEIFFDNPLFLVGRNGTGKSNVVDAFAFLADCLNTSLKAAVEERGGLGRIAYIGTKANQPFIELEVIIHSGKNKNGLRAINGSYLLRLKITKNRDYVVDAEECFIKGEDGIRHFFTRNDNGFHSSVAGLQPRLDTQKLALPIVGGIEEFGLLADGLAAMRVYHIDHHKIRLEEGVDVSPVLRADGGNVAGVLRYFEENGGVRDVQDALYAVMPTPLSLAPVRLKDGRWTFVGGQKWQSDEGATDYDRGAFSDGTLHALGLAVALQQNPPPTVLLIEEPENNLHPGALAAISDLIDDASRKTQVIITTHSPELLDAKWITPQNLRITTWENDATRVSELDESSKKALMEHLMYAGQLMEANALDVSPAPVETSDEKAGEPLLFAL